MRIRSTKPEFWESRTIAAVSWDSRLVLKALESYVDDNGVGKDDMELIVSKTFPRDHFREGSRIVARVSEAVSELCQAGLATRYEANGEDLLYIENWKKLQRVDKPQSGRFPRPDGSMDYKDPVNRDEYKNIREGSRSLLPGTGEQGNRGTEERVATSDEDRDAPESPKANDRDDIRELLDYLDQKIIEHDPDARLPHRSKENKDSARLLLDKDGRTTDQVKACIDYAFNDTFWWSNIRSMRKLRDKYDTLRAQAQANGHQSGTSPEPRRVDDDGHGPGFYIRYQDRAEVRDATDPPAPKYYYVWPSQPATQEDLDANRPVKPTSASPYEP